MTISDFTYATATELLAAMAAREVSSAELTEAAIRRVERYDNALNAVCVRDFARARAAAKNADAVRARGETAPLLGIPMTVKESFNIAGLPTTWGIPQFKNFRANEDAVAVGRIKTAGAVLLGKTNVPLALGDLQTYNAIYGTTHNPWDHGRTRGGSSGGSAAALAAGYGALSIGSDIAGSLRVPAHCCGIYAHKPSLGLVPGRGHTAPPAAPLPYQRDLTVIGPMARSATDLSILLDVLAGPDFAMQGTAYRLALPPARHENLSDYRVLVLDTDPLVPTAANISTAIDRLARRIAHKGARVSRYSPLLPDQIEVARLFMRLLMSSLSASLPASAFEDIRAGAAGLDNGDLGLAAERTRGTVMNHRDWLIADTARTHLQHCWRALFAEFDVVLCPVMPTVAFPLDESPDPWRRTLDVDGTSINYGDQLVWAGMATAPGLPATAIPIGRSDKGLPIGIQVLGPMNEDRTSLHFAHLLERAFGGFEPPTLGIP